MNITELVKDRINRGNEVLEQLSFINKDGISKLRSKIKQEINFLETRMKSEKIKEHLTCSNLSHLEAVAAQLIKHENICFSVMSYKVLKNGETPVKKICIDLILHGGSVWMKVIARNKKALTRVSRGDCSFGQKSIIDQALEFIECSKQNIHYFKPPSVIFFFANGIEDSLAQSLSHVGIIIEHNLDDSPYCGQMLHRPEKETMSSLVKDCKQFQNIELIKNMKNVKLNLGVTTLIAYVSALTNGGTNHNFESEILRKHAQWERERPVKPILDKLFEGRDLYCCQTAADIFKNILDVLGGEGERQRGEQLLQKVKIVSDQPTSKMKSVGKVKERSLAIFGTGEYLKAITVTANHAFVRSAISKGIYFEVFLHESRALTEGKELHI